MSTRQAFLKRKAKYDLEEFKLFNSLEKSKFFEE